MLNDLLFFNEFALNLSELINYYQQACVVIDSLENFQDIVGMFEGFFDDYDSCHTLLHHPDISHEKRALIQSRPWNCARDSYDF